MKISFVPQDPEITAEGVVFWAIVDGRRVRCVVRAEAMRDRFGAVDADAQLAAFRRFRYGIEQSAHGMITAGSVAASEIVIDLEEMH